MCPQPRALLIAFGFLFMTACSSSNGRLANKDGSGEAGGSATMGSQDRGDSGVGGSTRTGGASGSGGTMGNGGALDSGGTPENGGATGTGGQLVVTDAGSGLCATGSWPVANIPEPDTPGIAYLSDLTPSKVVFFDAFGGPARNGPMHNDVSYTGKALVINGVCYPKGVGVQTYAQITYDLGGAYKRFVADTGLDYLENSATMIFEVLLDGALAYDNGNGTKTKDQLAPVSLDVTGKNSMELYVRDGFDGAADDYGVWGGARLVK